MSNSDDLARNHRRVHKDSTTSGVVNEVEKVSLVDSRHRDTTKIIPIERSGGLPIESPSSLISQSLTDDEVELHLDTETKVAFSDKIEDGWTSNEKDAKILFHILSETFDDFQNQYIISRQLEARGYHVRNDGVHVLTSAKVIKPVPLDEVDYFVITNDENDSVEKGMDDIHALREMLDTSYPYDKDGFRIFTLGIAGQGGMLYGLRVHYVPINENFRLHRMNRGKNTAEMARLWRESKADPAYRRKTLQQLKFTIGEVYE